MVKNILAAAMIIVILIWLATNTTILDTFLDLLKGAN